MTRFTPKTCLPILFLLLFARTYAQEVPFDCVNARFLKDKSSVTVDGKSFGATGVFDERGTCFSPEEPERAPYWFTFTICKSGSLVAFIDPEGTADYDFVLYDVTNGCGAKGEMSCNYTSSVQTANITGIGCSNGANCNPVVSVFEGRSYAIMFSRHTLNSTAGFTLTLDGTCEFSNPEELNYQPKIKPLASVCGLSAKVSATTNPTSSTFQWTGSGPGTPNFDKVNENESNVTVDVPGIYTLYFSASKQICGGLRPLTDSIVVEFKEVITVFGDSTISACESNKDFVNLGSYLSGNPPANGTWSDLDNSTGLDATGRLNPANLGGGTYHFQYAVASNSNGSCIDTDAVVTVNVFDELTVQLDSAICYSGGTNFRLFTHITGGNPASYTVNGNPQASPFFASGFLTNQFQYSFEIADQSGCPAVILNGTKDCNCASTVAILQPTAAYDCATQKFTVQNLKAATVALGDVAGYVIYSNPLNPSGSIVAQSSMPSFTFQSPLNAGADYYIAAATGKDNGSSQIDLNDSCLSLSNAVKVNFPGSSSVQLSTDTTICEGHTASLKFNVSGASSLVLSYTENGTAKNLYIPAGSSNFNVKPDTTTQYIITGAKDNQGCVSAFSGTATVNVFQQPDFGYRIITDSVACVGANQNGPVMLFDVTPGDTVNAEYTINGIPQTALVKVKNGFIYSLPKLVSGRNTIQITKITSTLSGCEYSANYPAINYYYLDAPVVSVQADKPELCVYNSIVNVTFNTTGNLNTKVYYNINGVRLAQNVKGTTTVNFPVTTSLTFHVDSVTYTDYTTCVYPASATASVNLFTEPAVSFKIDAITCTEVKAKVEINSENKTAVYSTDGISYTADTIREFTTPGSRILKVRLGQACIYDKPFNVTKVDTFQLKTNVTHTTCNKNNGAIVPELVGVFYPPVDYSFNGSPNNTGLTPGSYTITAIDAAGCKVTVKDSIKPSEAFLFTVTNNDTVNCKPPIVKATVVLNASGGNGTSYTYSTNGVTFNGTSILTNLDPKYYWVYAKNDKGCIDSLHVKVKSDSLMTIGLTIQNYLKCFESTDGIVKVNVGPGTGTLQYSSNGYTYVTNSTLTNIGPGNNVFYIKETTGCKREQAIGYTMTRPDKINFMIQSSGNPVCENYGSGFFIMKATGNGNFLYTVNNGANFQNSGVFSGLPAGTYKLFVMNDAGCTSDTETVALTSPPPIIISSVDMVLNGTKGNITIHASGGSGKLTYSINDIQYYDDSTFVNLNKGYYTVYVKDEKGCIYTKDSVLIGTVGIGSTSALPANSAYPNPFENKLHLDLNTVQGADVTIYNTIGQVMYQGKAEGESDLNTTNWATGIYILSVRTETGIQTIKLEKR